MLNHLNDLRFQQLEMVSQKIEFSNELLLFKYESMNASGIFGPNTMCGQALELHEFGIRNATGSPTRGTQLSKTGQSEIGWGREARAQGQRGGKVGITSQASQLRKQFIADGVNAIIRVSHSLIQK